MTSRLLTPWWRSRKEGTLSENTAGSSAPTSILDWQSSSIRDLVDEARPAVGVPLDPQALLVGAHGLISDRVRPVYAMNDAQPASLTLARGRGSCSQRLAILEAVARATGTPTRVRGILVDGRFWYPRFSRVRFAVPDAVLLAWPEFLIGGEWVDTSALFGPVGSLNSGSGFSNADGETLFDAVARTAVDWDGVTSTPTSCSACDLSGEVLADLGRFNSRDELFARHGQTLCWPARTLAEPVMSRWSAGVTSSLS